MRLSNWRGILWFIWCSCTSGVVGQCTREELDRVGEEVAICVIRQQEMYREMEKIFVGNIFTQVNETDHPNKCYANIYISSTILEIIQ